MTFSQGIIGIIGDIDAWKIDACALIIMHVSDIFLKRNVSRILWVFFYKKGILAYLKAFSFHLPHYLYSYPMWISKYVLYTYVMRKFLFEPIGYFIIVAL